MTALPSIEGLRPLLTPLCALLMLCSGKAAASWQQENGYRYMDVAPAGKGNGFTRLSPEQSGVQFTNWLSRRLVALNRVTENGSGVALGDVDGDGLCDIYFCRLEGNNELYRNLGNWKFEDITSAAGVACPSQFSTGATLADLDGDGDLDLLVNSVGGGTRQFMNNGKGSFTELEGKLVRRFAATTSALGDIDRDGDLDLYVATYRTITSKDEIPPVKIEARQVNGKIVISPEGRFAVIAPRGGSVEVSELGERDFFYLNQGNGMFAPLSWTSGNFLNEAGAPLSAPQLDWGLSVLVRDLNEDLLPDIFVCNDFFYSPDRVFMNSPEGKFRMISLEAMTRFSLASMAVDVADINRDGFDDIFVAEMLSRDHPFRQTHRDNLDKAAFNEVVTEPNYRPEVPRNTLYLNRGNGTYAEIAEFARIDASEWSWGAVFLDVDLDGFEDLIIPTGNNHDVQQADILREMKRMRLPDSIPQRMSNLDKFGSLKSPILAFRNQADLTFSEAGPGWGFHEASIVNGLACADLDNDGDLDLVGNCLNDGAAIYRNESTSPRVSVRLAMPGPNKFGVGAKITVTTPTLKQSQQILAGARYLSNDDYVRTFAAPADHVNVSIRWPSGAEDTYENLPANRIYQFSPRATFPPPRAPIPAPLFSDVSSMLAHSHVDEPFSDLDRQPLLPVKLGGLGPGIAWFDENADGWDDLIVPAGRGGTLALFRNLQGRFIRATNGIFEKRVTTDATTPLGWHAAPATPALLIGQSNYEPGINTLRSVMGVHNATHQEMLDIPGAESSSGALALADIDNDGDLDLFVGGRVLPGRYPEAASSRIFKDESGKFVPDAHLSTPLTRIGLVTGAAFADFDDNGWPDLILATEWGSLRLFSNNSGSLQEMTESWNLAPYQGLWNSVSVGDFNNDGRLDLLAGNWGLNCKLRRYLSQPVRLYYGDLDNNGTFDVIEAFSAPGQQKFFPWQDFDTLHKAIPAIGERFKNYTTFASASCEEVFGPAFEKARHLQANWLASTLFLNKGGRFEPKALPAEAQFSPVFGIAVADFDGDGNEDAFLAQNFSGTRPDQGRLDAGCGLFLLGDGQGNLQSTSVLKSGIFSLGDQRGAAVCDFNHDGRPDLAFAQNNGPTRLYQNNAGRAGLRIRLQGPLSNPSAIGARVQLIRQGQPGRVREILAGSGYWSQDSTTHVWAVNPDDQLQVRWPGGKKTLHQIGSEKKELLLRPE